MSEYITTEVLNISSFDDKTKNVYRNEPIEAFWCPECHMIYIGLPDLHIALVDPRDLQKKVAYNRPEKLKCTRCKYIFPNNFLCPDGSKEHAVPVKEAILSEWAWLFKS
jgi:hypothetical protein